MSETTAPAEHPDDHAEPVAPVPASPPVTITKAVWDELRARLLEIERAVGIRHT